MERTEDVGRKALNDSRRPAWELGQSLHPVMVLEDRYGGVYSGGPWLAIGVADRLENGAYRAVRVLESGPSGDDVEAQFFWGEPPSWIAVGQTPDEAVARLRAASDDEVLRELDRKLAEGLADLEAGRVYTTEEVAAEMRRRFGRPADAAE